MAQVVTQNDLNDIIQSAVNITESSTKLVNAIIDSISKIKIKNVDINKTKNIVTSTIMYMNDVIRVTYESELFNDKKILDNADKTISSSFKHISEIISYIPKTLESISKLDMGAKNVLKMKYKIKNISELFISIIWEMQKSIIGVVNSPEFQTLYDYLNESEEAIKDSINEKSAKKIKHKGIVSILLDYIKLFTDITGIGDKNLMKSYIGIRANISMLTSILKVTLINISKSLNSVVDESIKDKLEIVNDSMEYYIKIIEFLSNLSLKSAGAVISSKVISMIDFHSMIQNLTSLNKIKLTTLDSLENRLVLLKGILNELNNVLISLFSLSGKLLGVKLINKLYNSISLVGAIIEKIITFISDINVKKLNNANKKLNLFKALIWGVATIISALILLAPIIIGFVLISPALLLAFWLFKLIINVIIKTISSIINIKTTLTILALIGLIGLMIIVGVFIYSLIMLSIQIMNGIIPLIAFFGIVLLVALAIVGIGWLILSALPILGPAAIGILALTVVVGAIFVLGLMLKILSVLNLDKKAILHNVDTVLDTAYSIITTIFESTYEIGGATKSSPWWKKVLGFLGGQVISLMAAILAVPILAMSVVSVGLILFMASMLSLLQKLTLKPKKIKENVSIVIDTVKSIIDILFNRDRDQTQKNTRDSKPWFVKVLNWAGGAIKNMIEAILAVGFLAVSLVSIVLIKFLAKQLSEIQKIDLNTDSIKDKISDIIGLSNHVISTIWAKDENQKHSEDSNFNLKSLFEWAFPNLMHLSDAIMSVGFLAISMVSIGLVKCLAEKLIEINDTPDLSSVSNKVSHIIESARTVIKSVFDSGGIMGMIKDVFKSSTILPSLNMMRDTIGALADISNSILSIKTNDIDGIDSKVSNIKSLYETIANFASNRNVVNNQMQVLEKHVEFIKKIDKMDIEKLKTSTNMFEKMAQFSESINGNFEGLANTLNEKIAPLMEELKGLLEGVQNKVEETGANMSKAAYNSGKTLSEPEMTAQVNSENPKADAEEKARIVQQRMEEQARAQTNALVSKIDELIELFKNGQAQVRTA